MLKYFFPGINENYDQKSDIRVEKWTNLLVMAATICKIYF